MSLPTHQAPPGRHVGVMKASSQVAHVDQEGKKIYGKKNSLAGFMEMRTFVLLYNDETGLQQRPLGVHEFGGKFYTAPNAADWGASLRELQPWLQEAAAKRLTQLDTTATGLVPADQVDVLSAEGSEKG